MALIVATRALALVAALHATCGGARRFVPPPPPSLIDVLGPNDVFAVRVFNETELSQEYRVSATGTIDFPYLGRLRVQGLEATQVADRIQEQLRSRGILREPQVSVFVREVNSRRIDVLGQVARPGSFPFVANMTIVQALTSAGGFTGVANREQVSLTRSYNGRRRTFVVPVQSIVEGRIANVVLAPGDVLSVPEAPL